MVLGFRSVPSDTKQDMLRLLDRWHGTKTGRRKSDPDILVDSLRILATPGSRAEFLRIGFRLPRENAMLSIAFVVGEGYQGKGALNIDDAQRLLDLIREMRKVVPTPPKHTTTAIMRAASILLKGDPLPSERDNLWETILPVLMVFDPSVFQGQLF